MDPNERDRLVELIERSVAQLAEHFDAVQIMVSSVTESNNTVCFKRGSGNYYARQAMATEFLDENIAQHNAREIGEVLEDDPPDEGEAWKLS